MTTESSIKYVCITTDRPDTKSNPNPNPKPKLTTKHQHAVVSIQLNVVTCPMYPERLVREGINAPLYECVKQEHRPPSTDRNYCIWNENVFVK